MAYLIGQMGVWLVVVAVLCAVAGWAFHAMQATPHLDALERERERLRKELLALGSSGDHGAPNPEGEREVAMLNARADVAAARAAELERALQDARDGREHAVGRIAELERMLDSVRAGGADAQQASLARIAELEREAQRLGELPREDAAEANARNWRLRYFEQRVKYLEGLPQPEPVVAADPDADRLRARVSELEGLLAAQSDADERNALRWRARYLEARVRYLESPEARLPSVTLPEEPSEDEKRRVWRMRYLEARLKYLGDGAFGAAAGHAVEAEALRAEIAALQNAGQQSHARLQALQSTESETRAAHDRAAQENAALKARLEALETEKAALKARIAALEAERAELTPKEDSQRMGWRNRYLDARVRHFEGLLAEASKPQPVAALQAVEPPEPAPAPLVPQGEEIKPPALPAARGGAPDDLTLIDGIGPKIENTLHSLGIYHFEQIAAWTPAHIAWVDQYLRFRGRIIRERWVEQAKDFTSGDFAPSHRRYLAPEPA